MNVSPKLFAAPPWTRLCLAGVIAGCLAPPAWSQTPPASAAVTVPAAAPAPARAMTTSGMVTDLECFRDPGGNLHKLAEDVSSSDGQSIGWISISQCPATGAVDPRLHVRLSGSFGDSMVVFDPSEVAAHPDSIVVKLTAAQVRARFPHAPAPLSRPFVPTAP